MKAAGSDFYCGSSKYLNQFIPRFKKLVQAILEDPCRGSNSKQPSLNDRAGWLDYICGSTTHVICENGTKIPWCEALREVSFALVKEAFDKTSRKLQEQIKTPVTTCHMTKDSQGQFAPWFKQLFRAILDNRKECNQKPFLDDRAGWVYYIGTGLSPLVDRAHSPMVDNSFAEAIRRNVDKLIDDATFKGLEELLRKPGTDSFGGGTPYYDNFVPRLKELIIIILKDRKKTNAFLLIPINKSSK